MQERPEISPEQMARMKKMIFIAIIIPLAIALPFTLMQWYPATYVIDYMTDDKGEFPVKITLIINWAALMVIELAVLLLVLPVVKIIKSRSKR